jgi:hypothetical protein
MPEAYWEAEELRREVRRLRPKWLRRKPDTILFKRLRYDCICAKKGVWDRIAREALLLQKSDAAMKERARAQAYELREEARNWEVTWESAPLTKLLARLSVNAAG